MDRLGSNGGTPPRLSALGSGSKITRLGSPTNRIEQLGPTFTGLDKLSGFALSAVESFPELFGIEPSDATMAFRASNPISGFASQAVGAFVPYLGAAKLARAAPVAGGFITGAETLGAARAGQVGKWAAGSAAEATVVEAARIGLGVSGVPDAIYEATTGRTAENRGASDLLLEGAFNIGGSAVLGGGLGALVGRFSRPTRFQDYHPDLAPDRPTNVRVRKLNEIIADAQNPDSSVNFPEPELARLSRERQTLIDINLEQAVPMTSTSGDTLRTPGLYRVNQGKTFRPVIGERKNPRGGQYGELSSFLNRARNWQSKGDLTTTRRLIVDPTGKGGYTTVAARDEVLAAVGKSREELGMEALDVFTIQVKPGVGKRTGTSTPLPESPSPSLSPEQLTGRRLLSTDPVYNTGGSKDPNQARANSIQRRLSAGRAWNKVGDGWNLSREGGPDGLFVMSKKVKGGLDPAPGDEWLVLRTDNPGAFDPKSAQLQARVLKSGYLPVAEELTPIGSGMWDSGVNFQSLTAKNIGDAPVGSPTKPNALGRIQAAGREIGELGGDYLAPSAPGAARNPLANQAFQWIKNFEAYVETKVDTLMRGSRLLESDKSVGRQLLGFKEVNTEGIDSMAKALSQESLDDIRFVLEGEIPADMLPDMMSRGLIGPEAVDFLNVLQKYSDDWTAELKLIGNHVTSESVVKMVADFQTRKGHYALSRETPGAYRILLQDADGNIQGVAAGRSPLDAKERAAEIIVDASKRGKILTQGAFIDEALADATQVAKFKAAILKPGFMKNRGDLLGYELQGKQLTGSALSKLVEKNIKRRENYLRDITMLEQMNPTLAQLDREAPNMAQFLRKRIAILNGDEGEFARAQNMIADKALALVGLSGKDSASAIVRGTQKVLSDFQFGFANLVNPLQNLLGIFQTVLPEISFASRISLGSSRNYVSLPSFDEAGNLVGEVSMLSDVKLFYSAMRNAAKPFGELDPMHQELVDQMIRERQLAPRFAEEQFGTNSALLANPRKALESGEGFMEFFGAANRVLVTKSEEFNRVVALNAAYEIAKMRGMNQGQMNVFTREFLSKTAFNYGTVDRATVFTTPVGSLLGTFKNWMFHYVANMLKYAGGGKETLPALFWQTGATALLGGAAATPFVLPLVDGASKFLTDKSAMENLYAAVGEEGEWMADGVIYGLPGSMGMSFASQIGSPGADPERDATMMFSLAMSDRMRALGSGTKAAVAAYATTGESPFNDEGVRNNLVRALAPRTIYRAMAVGEDGAIKSMASGYDVARLGPGSGMAYALGFNPTELEKTYEVYNRVRNNQNKKKAMTQEFGKTIAQAWDTGDTQLAARVFARSQAVGIDSSAILRSAKARQNRSEETQLDFAASPEDEMDYAFMFDGL